MMMIMVMMMTMTVTNDDDDSFDVFLSLLVAFLFFRDDSCDCCFCEESHSWW